jgi:hypothetical protein
VSLYCALRIVLTVLLLRPTCFFATVSVFGSMYVSVFMSGHGRGGPGSALRSAVDDSSDNVYIDISSGFPWFVTNRGNFGGASRIRVAETEARSH